MALILEIRIVLRFPFEKFINDAKNLEEVFVKLHKDAIKI